MKSKPKPKSKRVCRLPIGGTLHRQVRPDGSRVYTSTERPGGVHVWDTNDVEIMTLLAAIVEDRRYLARRRSEEERRHRRREVGRT